MTGLAVCADVHGNLPAPEAVPADLRGRGAGLVLDLAPDGTPLAVQHIALAYDWAAAARRAHALRTGRMPAAG
jgi:hypothetical protein